MEIMNGTENGIKYRVYLESKNWIAEVIDTENDTILIEKWEYEYVPRCGPDIADVNKSQEVIEKLINKLKVDKIGKFDTKEELLKIRNELYDAIPCGNIDAFSLIKVIKVHIKKLDEIIDSIK